MNARFVMPGRIVIVAAMGSENLDGKVKTETTEPLQRALANRLDERLRRGIH